MFNKLHSLYFVNYLTIFRLIRVCTAANTNISLQIAPPNRSKLPKPKHSISHVPITMNLKLYQKIYIVTNEQCNRLTVLNVRFQRYLRGQSTFLLPAGRVNHPIPLKLGGTIQSAGEIYYNRCYFPFLTGACNTNDESPTTACPQSIALTYGFLSLVLPGVRVYCNDRRTEYLFILCVRVY